MPGNDYKLPRAYGKTRLVLLVVDPYLIHAYWEVAPEKLDDAKTQALLRFYRSKPADFFDVEIDLQSHKWYVHLWRPEESLSAELMLKRNDGSLITLVRSQVIRMPPAQPKMSIEQRFMKVEATERRAEIVPPPPRPAVKPIDAAEILRESLKNVYASRFWHREQFKLESMRAANMLSPPPGRRAVDLTAMAERSFTTGISSGASDTEK